MTNSVPQNLFWLPKEVLCPQHNEIIKWLDLDQQSDNQRLFCSKCQRHKKVLNYNYVHSRLNYQFFELKKLERCQKEFNLAKKYIIEQIDLIENQLQLIFNSQQDNLHPEDISNMFDSKNNLTFDNLSQIVKDLSKQIYFKNNVIFFTPELTEIDKQKIKNIQLCTQLLQKSSKQIAKIQNLDYPPYQYQLLRLPLLEAKDIEKVNLIKYEQWTEISMPQEVSAIAMNYAQNQLAIACTNNYNQYEIQLWGIDSRQGQRRHMFNMIGHKCRIKIVDFKFYLISVDSQCNIIFWYFTPKTWFVWRIFQAQIEFINFIQFNYKFSIFALGGSSLQILKLNKKNEQKVVHLTKSVYQKYINCLRFNFDATLLVTGNEKGEIHIYRSFQEDWEDWRKIDKIQTLSFEPIRSIKFNQYSNDFACFQFGNDLIQFTQADLGYEYKIISIDKMDKATIHKGIMILPIISNLDQETEILNSKDEILTFSDISHFAIRKDSKIILYISKIQEI